MICYYFYASLTAYVFLYLSGIFLRTYYDNSQLQVRLGGYLLNSLLVFLNILSREVENPITKYEVSTYIFLLIGFPVLYKLHTNILLWLWIRDLKFFIADEKWKIKNPYRLKRAGYIVLAFLQDVIDCENMDHETENGLSKGLGWKIGYSRKLLNAYIFLMMKTVADQHKANCGKVTCFCHQESNYSEYFKVLWPIGLGKVDRNKICWVLLLLSSQYEMYFSNGKFTKSLMLDYVFVSCCYDGRPGFSCNLVKSYKKNVMYVENSTNKSVAYGLIGEMITYCLDYSLGNGNQFFWNNKIIGQSYIESVKNKSWLTVDQSQTLSQIGEDFSIDFQGTFDLITLLKKYKSLFRKQLETRSAFYNYILNEAKPLVLQLLKFVENFEKNDKKIEACFTTITEKTKNKFAPIFILHINYQEYIRINIQYTTKLLEKIKHLRKILNLADAPFSRLMIDSDGVVMQISGEPASIHNVEYLSSNCNLMFGYTISELTN